MKFSVEKVNGFWQWSTMLPNGNKLVVVEQENPGFDAIEKEILDAHQRSPA